MADENVTYRKINVGRITGLSAYELAVKYGYEGTEEEYVAREEKIFNDIKNIADTVPAFNSIKIGEQTLQATVSAKVLTLDADDNVAFTVYPGTNSLKIGLSDKFLKSIVFREELKEESK